MAARSFLFWWTSPYKQFQITELVDDGQEANLTLTNTSIWDLIEDLQNMGAPNTTPSGILVTDPRYEVPTP